MSARPDFLIQPAKMKKADRELQRRLQEEARAAGVVPTKDSRRQDFLERSINEVEAHLRKKKIDNREHLKERLKFLKGELARLAE
jgi:hypothetical protein